MQRAIPSVHLFWFIYNTLNFNLLHTASVHVGSQQRRVVVFLTWKLMGPNWREIVMGFQTLPFFLPLLSVWEVFLLTTWVHWGFQNSWQSIVSGRSLSPLQEKSSARQPVLSLKYKKLSKVKFLRAVNFHLAPQWGISVCPAPGRSHPMSAALHNLQTPLCAITH